VPENGSALFVPLRSNASTLLTGAPIAAMRRRLKFASLFYDHLYLEWGVLRVQVGPHGGSSFLSPPTDQRPARWQTPRQRHGAEQRPFQLSIGKEEASGAPQRMHVFLASDTTICWDATLLPFAGEFPPGTDWVDFGRTSDPRDDAGRLADQWTRADQRNPFLEQAIPVSFVRDTVIKHANRDLVIAVAAGTSVAIDPVHLQVVAQRFKDEEWRWRGYVVPILFPQVGGLPWEAIADLRRDPNLGRFRAVLREVEEEAAAEAAGGDVESAAHHAYENHLASAADRLEGLGGPARRAVAGFVIGGVAGFTTSGITGSAGIIAGAALGTAGPAAVDVLKVIKRRRTRGWVSLHQRIRPVGG